MTILITLTCLLIASAIFAGAFYLAQYVVRLEQRKDALEAELKRAEEHIEKVEQFAEGLQQELEFERAEKARRSAPEERGGWNPADPLNSMERR